MNSGSCCLAVQDSEFRKESAMRRLIEFGVGCLFIIAASCAWGEDPPSQGSGVASPSSPPVMLFPIVKDGKWGYMNEKGKVVIEPKYQLAWDFSEGLATVALDALRGYIDQTGNLVIPTKFGWAGKFCEGLARVNFHKGRFGTHIEWYRAVAGVGFIDKTGKTVTQEAYSTGLSDFSEGVAWIVGGYIGKDGKKIPFEGEEGSRFSEGMAAARKGSLWGYIDHSMKFVVQPEFTAAREFSEGLAAVMIPGTPPPEDANALKDWQKNVKSKWGFIDKTGKVVIPGQFVDAGRFSEGRAPVLPELDVQDAGGSSSGSLSGGAGKTWGYVDKDGIMAVKPQFDYAWPFSEGFGRVLVGGKFGYVDKNGKFAVEPKYDTAWEFSKGLARVGMGDKEGYINHDGKYVWEPTE